MSEPPCLLASRAADPVIVVSLVCRGSVFKLLFLGGAAVGKSSMLAQVCDKEYITSYIPTMAVDFVRIHCGCRTVLELLF